MRRSVNASLPGSLTSGHIAAAGASKHTDSVSGSVRFRRLNTAESSRATRKVSSALRRSGVDSI